MQKKKSKGIIQLMQSSEPYVMNSRFIIKASKMNNGVNKESIMMVVTDLVESGFTIKFFDSEDEATAMIKLLHAASS